MYTIVHTIYHYTGISNLSIWYGIFIELYICKLQRNIRIPVGLKVRLWSIIGMVHSLHPIFHFKLLVCH